MPAELRTPTLKRRIRLIEECSNLMLRSIPPIRHSWENELLRQKMPCFPNLNMDNVPIEEIYRHLLNLANDIECIHEKGLIHGDIHPKNVLYTGTELKLIDFEPILEYSSKGIHYYCSTQPWIAHEDLKNKRLSVLTDRIGFTHTAMRLLQIAIPPFNIKTTFRERHRIDQPIGGVISDGLVRDLNAPELLKYLYTRKISS